jgi:cytidylate kinase
MITISRQAFAGGEQIAHLLAEESGSRLLDSDMVKRLLEQHGLPRMEAAAFDERKPGLWHRFSAEREKYLHYLKLVTFEFARQGDCLILGRGGQILLASIPGVMKVRVIAPLRDRIANARATFRDDEHRAWQAVQHTDNERAGFYRFLYAVDWERSDLYDLVVNTHGIPVKTAADVIGKAIGSKGIEKRKREASRELARLCLVEKTIVEILYTQKLPIYWLEIGTENGAITLRGTARDHPSIEHCQEIAAEQLGVDSGTIRNEISFAPKYVEMLGGIGLGAVS